MKQNAVIEHLKQKKTMTPAEREENQRQEQHYTPHIQILTPPLTLRPFGLLVMAHQPYIPNSFSAVFVQDDRV